MTLWHIAIVAVLSLPFLFLIKRKPRVVEVRGRVHAIRTLSQAEVIRRVK
jgi:hypothetical protein